MAHLYDLGDGWTYDVDGATRDRLIAYRSSESRRRPWRTETGTEWYGVNGWRSNARERCIYREEAEAVEDDLQKALAEEMEHSAATRDEQLPQTGVRRRGGQARVVSIRLDPDDIETIEQIARGMDVPMAALVRGGVLRGVAEDGDESLASAVERARVDIERVRELLG